MDAQIRALMLYMKLHHDHDHDLDFAHHHHHHHHPYQILIPNSTHTFNDYNTNDRIYLNPNPNSHHHHSHYTKKSYKLWNNMARLGRSDHDGQCESARCRALIRRLRTRIPTSCFSPSVCVGALACECPPPLNLLYDPISYALNFDDAPKY